MRLSLALLLALQPLAHAQPHLVRSAGGPAPVRITGLTVAPRPVASLRRSPAPLKTLPRLAAAPKIAAPRALPLPVRLAHLSGLADDDIRSLKDAPGEGSRELADAGFSRLTGERLIAADAAPAVPGATALAFRRLPAPDARPASASAVPKSAAPAGSTRRYLAGTAAFKFGMEALSLAVPLLAMTVFGSVGWAAVMSVGWVLSQAFFGTMAGGLLDRHPPEKILSRSMAGQAAAVTALLALFVADKLFPLVLPFPMFNPVLVLAFYSMAGAFMGAADTARQEIPPAMIGKDEKAVKVFNARAHVAYEVAGVAGVAAAGAAIKAFGLAAALAIHPPFYLLAAFIFSRLNLGPRPPPAEPAAPREKKSGWLKGYLDDIRQGFKTVWSKPVYRWGALALVIPLAVHRILEGLLIPTFAKKVLEDPSASAWIVGASNLGELIGAVILMKVLTSGIQNARTAFWVRLMSLGLLAVLAFSVAPTLWIILPLIAFKSATWAASDLSLRGKLQNSLPEAARGRAFGFIGALGYFTILAASLSLGFLIDALGAKPVLWGVGIAVAALVLLLWKAAGVLAKSPK